MSISWVKKFALFVTFLSVVFLPMMVRADDSEYVERVNSGEVPIGWQCKVQMKVQGIFASFVNDNLVGKTPDQQAQIISSQSANALCFVENFQSNSNLVSSVYRYEMGKQINLFAIVNNIFRITKERARENGFLMYYDSVNSYFTQLSDWQQEIVVDRCLPLPNGIWDRLSQMGAFGMGYTLVLEAGQSTRETVTESSCPNGVFPAVYPVTNGVYNVVITISNDRQYFVNEKANTDVNDEPISVPYQLPISLKSCDGNDLNPFGCISIPQLIGRVLNIGIGLLGTFALLWFLYAGVLWMFAAGNSERQDRAFKMLLWGALGLMVIFASYAIISFVFDAFV